jgi:hypothetical protein
VTISAAGLAAGQIDNLNLVAQRPELAGRPVSLPPRPVTLAGREDLLAGLQDRLAGGDGPWPRIVALYGIGGAGKTSVAAEYAHRRQAEFGVAWQFAAEDRTSAEAGFVMLGALLGAAGGALDPRDPVASVHAVLADSPLPWLLIFDNAPDADTVQRFIPPAGPGRVLITSQHGLWPPGQGLEVPALDTGVAAVFLMNRTTEADHSAAEGLADELGGLPLALEQAGAYIQASAGTLTMAGYLAEYRRRRADLLAQGEASGHRLNVAATLGLALSQLETDAPAAAGLLRLLACLAPEPVPLGLLLTGAGTTGGLDPGPAAAVGPLLADPVAAAGAVAALRRYSLVTPAGVGLVLVHRLVQAITLDQLPAEAAGQWKQAAAALVEAAIPADSRLPAAWPVCGVLLPHARAVLDLSSDGMRQMGRCLGESGSYAAARDLFQLIADAYNEKDAYGPEHRDTLSARHQLARWTGQAGDAAGARDQTAALLPVSERVLGPEHPFTLLVRGGLAYWTGQAGDAAGARDQFAALLPVEEQVLGAEHYETMTTRSNLALYTALTGDAAGARDQYAALLPIRERVLGPEHPNTLSTRLNLATATGRAGDAAEARDETAALLPIRERVLGAEHPDTLTTRDLLADWTGQAGDAAGARDQYAALLPIYERVLGAEHPDTLSTRDGFAYWTKQAQGDTEAGVN